jgi:hypothetical protein
MRRGPVSGQKFYRHSVSGGIWRKIIAQNNKIVSDELSEEDIKEKGHGPF